METVGTAANDWFKDAFNQCADMEIGGSTKTPVWV